jgi:hypothetical protein
MQITTPDTLTSDLLGSLQQRRLNALMSSLVAYFEAGGNVGSALVQVEQACTVVGLAAVDARQSYGEIRYWAVWSAQIDRLIADGPRPQPERGR